MLIYKQRYKPRTTREFTKSDLTVYDSAGNTALNALTVYGKSEVVDGAIVSAGEGWATVDLGTLNWYRDTTTRPADGATIHAFYTEISLAKTVNDYSVGNLYLSEYKPATKTQADYGGYDTIMDKICAGTDSLKRVWIYNSQYNDYTAEQFKTAMSGVLLCYELADPTQGNCIAVKTDDGTGIDGTMAVFETGTPLYGVNDTVRDIMEWDGSAGTVTKNCGDDRLADLSWSYNTNRQFFYAEPSVPAINADDKINGICSIYTSDSVDNIYRMTSENKSIGVSRSLIYIKDTDYTTVPDFVASLGDAELVYELATPTTEQLTSTENANIAGLRTFTPQTHAQNNAQTEMTVDYTIRVPTI